MSSDPPSFEPRRSETRALTAGFGIGALVFCVGIPLFLLLCGAIAFYVTCMHPTP